MEKLIMLAMVIGLLMSSVCYAEPVKICGVTLGRPFNESGIQECKVTKYAAGHKIYDYNDSNCYTADVSSGYCFATKLQNVISLPVTIYVMLSNKCDKTSEVEEIQIGFDKDTYNSLLALVESRFGKANTTTTSQVQTLGGAKFEKIISIWNMSGGEVIYLTNMHSKVTEGFLRASSSSKAKRDSDSLKKRIDKDKEKF